MGSNNINVFRHINNPLDVDLVIQNICKNLTVNDLTNVRLINKRWNTFALQQLKRESYEILSITSNKIPKFVRTFLNYLTIPDVQQNDIPFSKIELGIPLSIMEHYYSNPDTETINDRDKIYYFLHNFAPKVKYLRLEVSKNETESNLLNNGYLFKIFTNLEELQIDFVSKHYYNTKFRKLLKLRTQTNTEETKTIAHGLSKLSFGLASTLDLITHFNEDFFQEFLNLIPNVKCISFSPHGFCLQKGFILALVKNKTNCSQITSFDASLDKNGLQHLVSLSQNNNLRLQVIKIPKTNFGTNNEFCELLNLNSTSLKVVNTIRCRNFSSNPELLTCATHKMVQLEELDMIMQNFISHKNCFLFAETFPNLKKLVIMDGCNYGDLTCNRNGSLPFIFMDKFWDDLQYNNTRPLLTLKELNITFQIEDDGKMQDLMEVFPNVAKVELNIANNKAKNILKCIWTNANWTRNIVQMTLNMKYSKYDAKYRNIDPALIGLKRQKCINFRDTPKYDWNSIKPIDSMLEMTNLQELYLNGDFEISDSTGYLLFCKMKELRGVYARPNNNYHPFISDKCRKLLEGKVKIRGISLVQHPMYS